MNGERHTDGCPGDALDGEAGLPAARTLSILPAAPALGVARQQLQDAAAALAGLAVAVGIFKVLAAVSGIRALLRDHSARLAAMHVD
ncbi:MAG TPA: hypothetical protein VGG90_06035 [Candidatus Dormibacteraeota bacterium]|jgi:hypothetical protein